MTDQEKLKKLIDAGEWALRGIEMLTHEEAHRTKSTFDLCDYTFTKNLRRVLREVKEQKR